METFHSLMLYNRESNMFLQDNNTNNNQENWNKWNKDPSRIDSPKSTTISYVCGDSRVFPLQPLGKSIGNCPILVAETLSIREAIGPIWMSLSNIVKSDSQVVVLFIMDNIVMLKLNPNLIEDIRSLTREIRNVRFSYYKRTSNTLVDWIARKAHVICCKKM